MEKFKLSAHKREEKTPNQIRREGNVPGTMYGPSFTPENVQFCAREFGRLPVGAYGHLLELNMDGGKPINVIIRRVQRKSTTGAVLNVEFYRVSMDKKITVEVPIKFIGVAPAITLGAQLNENADTVEIECLPNDIPEHLEADLSILKEMESALHFSDLKVPANVKILNPLDEIVVRAATPRAASEEEKPAAEGEAAPAAEEKKGE